MFKFSSQSSRYFVEIFVSLIFFMVRDGGSCILLHVGIKFVLRHLLMSSFSPMSTLWHLYNTYQGAVCCTDIYLVLQFCSMINMPVCVPEPCWFCYCDTSNTWNWVWWHMQQQYFYLGLFQLYTFFYISGWMLGVLLFLFLWKIRLEFWLGLHCVCRLLLLR